MKLVIKIGGTLLEQTPERQKIAARIARLARADYQMLIVHGGGKQLSKYLKKSGTASRFVNGLRLTTAETLDGVVKVFAGTVNHQLLAALHQAGVPAAGISGVDGGCLQAEKLTGEGGQDWGYVGRIRKANPRLWEVLLAAGMLPVMASLAVGENGQIYNVNADQTAVACAVHLGADALIFLTDVDGVRDAQGRTIRCLEAEEIPTLIESGTATGGMLAKLNAVREALAGDVQRVHIVNGHSEDALESVLAAAQGLKAETAQEADTAGTVVVRSPAALKKD